MATTRIETDSLGKVELPSNVYYGVHTARAASNFPITGMLLCDYPELIQSLGMVKKAATLTNIELGELDQRIRWFAQYGVRECWLVHQLSKEVEVLQLSGARTRRTFRGLQPIESTVLPGFGVAPALIAAMG